MRSKNVQCRWVRTDPPTVEVGVIFSHFCCKSYKVFSFILTPQAMPWAKSTAKMTLQAWKLSSLHKQSMWFWSVYLPSSCSMGRFRVVATASVMFQRRELEGLSMTRCSRTKCNLYWIRPRRVESSPTEFGMALALLVYISNSAETVSPKYHRSAIYHIPPW
jgi:hypothetical protein